MFCSGRNGSYQQNVCYPNTWYTYHFEQWGGFVFFKGLKGLYIWCGFGGKWRGVRDDFRILSMFRLISFF